MAMADEQSAWPKKRPLTPAYAASRCATTIAISNPTSHAAAIIGPGCATQTAPCARSPESQLTATPTTNAAASDRKNPATPMVIDRGRVLRWNAATSSSTNATMATASENCCGHQTTMSDNTS